MWETHLGLLSYVLDRLQAAGAKISLEKGQWCKQAGVSRWGLKVKYAKKKNNAVAQCVAELHDYAAAPLPLSDTHHPEPTPVPTNHKTFVEADCFAFPKVYVDGSAHRKTGESAPAGLQVTSYLTDLGKHLQGIFKFAKLNMKAEAVGIKVYYDQKACKKEYQVGDKVLYRLLP
ncbi:hypothetical protein AAFF_G00062340 [Aldrovandia affinis]|uniref:Uncharacterized protein n=1 Tax=Aldrovandia affinis TaxID=143900 RepID=A0AAD7RZY6_9TELE|nr:hypothetical protein AAFF_G00062340 [Aldrovandia affinis]